MSVPKNNFKPIIALVLVLVVVLGFFSVRIVSEGERGIKFRFDKIVRNDDGTTLVYEPGIHFVAPFISDLKLLSSKIKTFDGQSDRFVTVEKKDVLIDSYIKWRIVDFGRFYTTTLGDYSRANELLHRKVNDRLRAEIGGRTISDIVSGSRGELMSEARRILNSGEDSASEFGIEVVDVRIKKINLPEEVSSSIYQRMRAERLTVANEHRSKGREEAAFIIAETDRVISILLAGAESKSKEIRGEGEAKAAEIYNNAYSKNIPLFNFTQTLDSYTQSFANKNSILIINPKNDGYYKYLFTEPKL